MAHTRSLLVVWLMSWLIGAVGAAGATQPPRPLPIDPHQLDSDARRIDQDAYLRLLERYRADADSSDPAVLSNLRDFWRPIYATNDAKLEHSKAVVRLVPNDLVPLAAMAATDLAIASLDRDELGWANHDLSVAELLINRLKGAPHDSPRERFARDWFHLIIWLRMARSEGADASKIIDRALMWFPEDAELFLSKGALLEQETKGRRLLRRMAPESASKPDIEFNRQIIAATWSYRLAMTHDPNQAEARIRLAFLLASQGGHSREEALTLLKEARALTTKPTLMYLAALFEGDAEEKRGDLAAASLSYRTAIATCPRAQTARLALSHVQLHQYDNERAAQTALRPLIGGPPKPDWSCEPDPWRMYEFGQAWRIPELVQAMRKHVREGIETDSAKPSGGSSGGSNGASSGGSSDGSSDGSESRP